MKLKNCKECGRMFQANLASQKLCQRCGESEDNKFLKVREYIYDNPRCSVVDVSNTLEIEEELILKWLREGRLTLKGEGSGYPCERCESIIQTGRFCASCANKMSSALQASAEALKNDQDVSTKQSQAGMWTAK